MGFYNLREIRGNEVLNNLFKLLSAASFAQLVPLLIYPFLTRIYSPTEFGTLALFMSITGVLAILSTGRFEFAIMLPKEDIDAANLLGLGTSISLCFSILLFILSFFTANWIGNLLNNVNITPWLPYIPLSILFTANALLLTYWANRQKQFGIMGMYNVNQSLTSSAGRLGLGYAGQVHTGLILGTLAGQFIATGVLFKQTWHKLRLLYRDISLDGMMTQAKKYINFPKFRMIHAFINSLSTNLPIFVLSGFFTPEMSGFYSIAFTVVFRPVTLFNNAVSQVFSQQMIEKLNRGESIYSSTVKFVSRYLKLGIVPFLITALIAPWLAEIALGKTWREAGVFLQIIIPWLFMIYLVVPLTFIPDVLGEQKKALIIDVVYLVLRIAALAIGVAFHSVILALLFFSFVGVLVQAYNLYWFLGMARGRKNITDPASYYPENTDI